MMDAFGVKGLEQSLGSQAGMGDRSGAAGPACTGVCQEVLFPWERPPLGGEVPCARDGAVAFTQRPGWLGGWGLGVGSPCPHSRSPAPPAGTEFEYTDSESDVKVRKRSPAGLLRPKKGPGESGSALAAPSARVPGPTSPDKAKLAAEKGRKARKPRGPKEPGLEAGPEASDDDLWTRRRSERIFLHDASAAPAPSSAAPAAAKAGRCAKAGPASPRKDAGRAKDRKDPRKVASGGGGPRGRDPTGHSDAEPVTEFVVGTLGAPWCMPLIRTPGSQAFDKCDRVK